MNRWSFINLLQYMGWLAIVVFTLVPVLLLQNSTNSFEAGNFYMNLTNVGKILGIAGFMLYAINFLLSTRLRVLESFFGGLPKLYRAHHIVGSLALLCILFHPVLMVVRYLQEITLQNVSFAGEQLLFTAMPSLYSVQTALNAGILAFWGMVVLLMLTFYARLPYGLWVFTHKFLGLAFVFAGFHVIYISPTIRENQILYFYVIFWFIVALISFAYRSVLGSVTVRRFGYKLVSSTKLADGIYSLHFTPENRAIASYDPGQFVFLSSADIQGEAHPFTVVSVQADKMLEINVKALGDFTQKLVRLPKGSRVALEGAFGKFSRPRKYDAPQLWIAGGIGITPFISMAKKIPASVPRVHLVYSVHHKEQEIARSTFTAIAKRDKRFTMQVFESSKQKRHMHLQDILGIGGPLSDYEVFLCGPQPMVADMRNTLIAAGVRKNAMHSEEFSLR